MGLIRLGLGAATLAVTVLGTAGCATMKSEPTEIDTLYIAYVEGAAKRYATQVIWINLPRRPVSGAEPAQSADPAVKPATQ
jgi:hypothetical protein